jgi:hypothetical protein
VSWGGDPRGIAGDDRTGRVRRRRKGNAVWQTFGQRSPVSLGPDGDGGWDGIIGGPGTVGWMPNPWEVERR